MKTIRILTIPLPANEKLKIALLKIYGLGQERIKILLNYGNLNENKLLNELKNKELNRLIYSLNYFIHIKKWQLHYKLRKSYQKQIEKLKTKRTYIGIRHQLRLPVRGQRTRSNGKTVKRIRY